MEFEEKHTEGALVRPTDGVTRPDVTIHLDDSTVEGIEVIDVYDENDYINTYLVFVWSNVGSDHVTVSGFNMTPQEAAAKAAGQAAAQARDIPEGVPAVHYQVREVELLDRRVA